jgi:hypothetical protein
METLIQMGANEQYLRQLWTGRRLKNWVSSTQPGDLLKGLSQ